MQVHPDQCPTLVLNADFRPLSYYPLSLWSWQEAIKAVFLDRVNVVSEYHTNVHSPSTTIKIPSVIALKNFISPPETPAFTRFNVFLRDDWQCQYCGGKFVTHDLTFDHVIPRAKGGQTHWGNIVTSCRECNMIKGAKLPRQCHMHPIRQPRQPTIYELQRNGRSYPPNFLHESWSDYLYWDTTLETE